MGDPFSVTGTVVGIASLGIQTFQILYKFCSDFKNFPREVELVQRQIKGLQGILEGLYEVKERLEIDNHVPSSQLNIALKACEETLHKLKRMAEKRNPTSPSEGIQTKIRAMKERALWSYKKEDLEEVQSSLARFQSNLSLALQCAGLDGALRRLEEMRSELGIQRQQAIKIEQSLSQGTEALEMIRRDVASQNPALSTIYNEIVNLRTHLLENSATRIDSYSSSDSNSSSRESIYAPSGSNNASARIKDLALSHQFAPRQRSIGARQSYPCCCRSRRKHKSDSRGWYRIVTDEAYDHSKDCPRSAHSDYTKSVVVQLSMYNSLLKFCVQIGWQQSRRGGWNSPAPVLRYRAVVSSDSPVFALLGRKLDEFRDHKANGGEVSAFLSSTALQLRQMFGKTASPTDLDQHGNGILYAVLWLLQFFPCTSTSESAIFELLDACFDEGVPFDEPDADGHFPVFYWQLTIMRNICFNDESRKGHTRTLFHLTQKVKSWSVIPGRFIDYEKPNLSLGSTEHVFFDRVSDLLKLESCYEGLYEDDPLREAILRKSECDFALMTTQDNNLWKLHDVEYMVLLLSWPQGLYILFSSLDKNGPLELLERLLNYAVCFSSPKSVEILLNQGVTATLQTWRHVTYRLYNGNFSEDRQYKPPSEQETSRWIKICDTIATQLHPSYNVGSRRTIASGSGHTTIGPAAFSLYHAECLTVVSAESAWRTGHRGLNSISTFLTNERRSWYNDGTPIWIHANATQLGFFSVSHENHVELLMWLIRHGADPFWVHPTHLMTPAHVLARRAFALTLPSEHLQEDTLSIFSADLRDSCYCRCSRSGCSVIGCAVPGLRTRYREISKHAKGREYIFKLALKRVFKIVQSEKSKRWMVADVIRVMTFEELSLTHTCCQPLHDRYLREFTRPSPEEAEEIHDLERDDIDLLERIVAELEEKWSRYNRSFLTFMNRVWRPRMRKMHEDRKVDEASYQAQLASMGISLDEQNQEPDWDAESYGSWSDESEDADSEGWYTTDEEADEGIE